MRAPSPVDLPHRGSEAGLEIGVGAFSHPHQSYFKPFPATPRPETFICKISYVRDFLCRNLRPPTPRNAAEAVTHV